MALGRSDSTSSHATDIKKNHVLKSQLSAFGHEADFSANTRLNPNPKPNSTWCYAPARGG